MKMPTSKMPAMKQSLPKTQGKSPVPHLKTRRIKPDPGGAFPMSPMAFPPPAGGPPTPDQSIAAPPGGMPSGAAPGDNGG